MEPLAYHYPRNMAEARRHTRIDSPLHTAECKKTVAAEANDIADCGCLVTFVKPARGAAVWSGDAASQLKEITTR